MLNRRLNEPKIATTRVRIAPNLAVRIAERVRTLSLKPGEHLREQHLATDLGVSRSPVREALEILAQRGVVTRHPNRGYYVAKRAAGAAQETGVEPPDPVDALYLKIADDRLEGALPVLISEAIVMREYDVPRRLAQQTLVRLAGDGLLERRPARGWAFPDSVTSYEAYEQGFRFRSVIEPAGLLQPAFRIVPREWARLRDTQLRMADATPRKFSPIELFRMGAEFHENLASWSGNRFFVDAITRQNQLRRIFEYRAKVDMERVRAQSVEHLQLLDLLNHGENAEASALLNRHIETARKAKLLLLQKHRRITGA